MAYNDRPVNFVLCACGLQPKRPAELKVATLWSFETWKNLDHIDGCLRKGDNGVSESHTLTCTLFSAIGNWRKRHGARSSAVQRDCVHGLDYH